MAIAYNPSIARNGLILHLDAANIKSYSGSGTTWSDLSGNGNSGTLVNAPTFSSSNSGSFIFDGTNQKITSTNNASLQVTVGTIGAWFTANNTNSGYNGIITKQLAWGLLVKDNVLMTYDWGNSADRSTAITVGNNTWYHAMMSFSETVGTPSNNAKIYLNGELVLTTTIKHSNHTVTLQIADANANQFLDGRVSSAMVYNRVLSAAEVQQNFNALRGRYSI